MVLQSRAGPALEQQIRVRHRGQLPHSQPRADHSFPVSQPRRVVLPVAARLIAAAGLPQFHRLLELLVVLKAPHQDIGTHEARDLTRTHRSRILVPSA